MAIFQYHDHDVRPPIDSTISDLSQYAFSTRAFLSMLGDYWTDYYKGTIDLAQAHTGSITGAGRQMTRLYELLLSGNIIDFPVEQGPAFDLLVFDKDDFHPVINADGEIESYFVSAEGCDISTFQYLTTSLFESAVVLVNGEHFTCSEKDNGVYFYVDIFDDPAIASYEYTIGDDSVHKVLLWASPIVVNHFYMYERYGRFIYQKALDSYKYKWLLTGLMRYYTGAKSCANIQKVLDILFGIPYCRADEETITDLTYTDEDLNDWTNPRTDEASFIRITTDKRVYYTYAMAVMDYGVGDTLTRNQMFGHFCRVLDYINTPGWWANEAWYFPDTAFDSDLESSGMTREEKNDIMDRLLKYNTVYFNVNIAYESYDLYKQIVGELYSLIKRGFPVYLNPYIEVIFRTAFSDDTDFWEKAKDCLYPLVGTFQYWDEFCRIIRYNGIEDHIGFWRYGLWDHHWGRMTDKLDLTLVLSDFEDVVTFCPYYDGMFVHDAEMLYGCTGMFAYDKWNPWIIFGGTGGGDGMGEWHDDGWTENAAGLFVYKDAMEITSLGTSLVDMFDPPLRYDRHKTYGGKVRPQPWNGTYGHRVRDVMGVPGQPAFDLSFDFHDWVVYEGNIYDAEHEHDAEILYDGTMFCGELFQFVAFMPLDLGSEDYRGTFEATDNLDVGYILHPYFDDYGNDQPTDDKFVLEHQPQMEDAVSDYRCPIKHNKVINHKGYAKHKKSCSPLALDDFDITFCHVDDSDTVSPVMNNFIITKITTT